MIPRVIAIVGVSVIFMLSWTRNTIYPHATRALSAIALSILLAGCSSMRYGNFLPDLPSNQQPIIQDAAVQLSRLYPPAQNTFALKDKTPDRFGMDLLEALRGRGYAIAEVNEKGIASDAPGALQLRYVLDRTETNLFRLTLVVGEQAISRPYREQFQDLVPAGDWTRRE